MYVSLVMKLIVFYPCHMVLVILVNTDLGNGLVPYSTKPLPKSMLTYHQWCSMHEISQEVLQNSVLNMN